MACLETSLQVVFYYNVTADGAEAKYKQRKIRRWIIVQRLDLREG